MSNLIKLDFKIMTITIFIFILKVIIIIILKFNLKVDLG